MFIVLFDRKILRHSPFFPIFSSRGRETYKYNTTATLYRVNRDQLSEKITLLPTIAFITYEKTHEKTRKEGFLRRFHGFIFFPIYPRKLATYLESKRPALITTLFILIRVIFARRYIRASYALGVMVAAVFFNVYCCNVQHR